MGVMPVKLRRWIASGALVVAEQSRPVIDATGWGVVYIDRLSGKLRIQSLRGGDRTLEPAAGGGSGDVVGPASSVASEVALFDGTTGKLIKRATGTGLAKITSGVLSVVSTWATSTLTGTASRLASFDGSGNPTDAQTIAETRAAGGVVKLDALGLLGLDASLASERFSIGRVLYTNNAVTFYGMANPSIAGTGGTPTAAAYSNRFGTANSGFFQGTRLVTRDIGFGLVLGFKLPTSTTSRRFWLGLGSTTMADSDTAAGSFVGLRYSTVAGDAGFTAVSRDGTSQTVGTVGTAPVADVAYLLIMWADTGVSSVRVVVVRLSNNTTVLDATVSATLPAGATAIDWLLYNHGQGTSRAVEISHVTRLLPLT